MQEDISPLVIGYDDLILEIPVWLALLMALIVICTFLLIYKIFLSIKFFFRLSKYKKLLKNNKKGEEIFNKGFNHFVQGEITQAEHDLLKAAKTLKTPWGYIFIAIMSAKKSAWGKANKYLDKAEKTCPQLKPAINLLKAENQLHANKITESRKTMASLENNSIKALEIESKINIKQGDLVKLEENLLSLIKAAKHEKEGLGDTLTDAYLQLLPLIANSRGKKALLSYWKKMPVKEQSMIKVQVTLLKCLIKLNAHDDAEQLAKKMLKKKYHEDLIEQYGLIYGKKIAKQIKFLESFLSSHQNESKILVSLSNLCMQEKLWGKARNYLEAKLSLQADALTCKKLAALLKKLGEDTLAQEYYQRAIGFIDDENYFDKQKAIKHEKMV